MQDFNLKELQEKGQAGLNTKISALIGAVIMIFLVVALAPEMFDQVDAMDVVDTNVPAWVITVLFVIIGAGVVFLIWRSFN